MLLDINRYQMLFESRESKNISKARNVCKARGSVNPQADVECVRNLIPNSRMYDCMFLPGVCRMYYEGGLSSGEDCQGLNKIFPYLEAHLGEYDQNLNGEQPSAIINRFRGAAEADVNADKEKMSSYGNDGSSDYEIVEIRDFAHASEYRDYTTWCVTQTQQAYNNYTNGMRVFYFLLRKGFDVVDASDTNPKGDYGTSMIAVSVNPDGSLNTATGRWNHSHGGDDHLFTTEEISQILNRNFYEVCPPKDINAVYKSWIESGKVEREELGIDGYQAIYNTDGAGCVVIDGNGVVLSSRMLSSAYPLRKRFILMNVEDDLKGLVTYIYDTTNKKETGMFKYNQVLNVDDYTFKAMVDGKLNYVPYRKYNSLYFVSVDDTGKEVGVKYECSEELPYDELYKMTLRNDTLFMYDGTTLNLKLEPVDIDPITLLNNICSEGTYREVSRGNGFILGLVDLVGCFYINPETNEPISQTIYYVRGDTNYTFKAHCSKITDLWDVFCERSGKLVATECSKIHGGVDIIDTPRGDSYILCEKSNYCFVVNESGETLYKTVLKEDDMCRTLNNKESVICVGTEDSCYLYNFVTKDYVKIERSGNLNREYYDRFYVYDNQDGNVRYISSDLSVVVDYGTDPEIYNEYPNVINIFVDKNTGLYDIVIPKWFENSKNTSGVGDKNEWFRGMSAVKLMKNNQSRCVAVDQDRCKIIHLDSGVVDVLPSDCKFEEVVKMSGYDLHMLIERTKKSDE